MIKFSPSKRVVIFLKLVLPSWTIGPLLNGIAPFSVNTDFNKPDF
jgi:hypothetical protein